MTMVKGRQPNTFYWSKAEGGKWSDGSNWTNYPATGSAPRAAGGSDYVLCFNQPGNFTVTNDLNTGFLLNRLDLKPVQGQGLTVAGKALAFRPTGHRRPAEHQRVCHLRPRQDRRSLIPASDLAVNLVTAGQLVIDGSILPAAAA